MLYENITMQVEEGIALLTINRPKALNALNAACMTEIAQALDEVRDNAAVGALIVTGAGEKAFIAGADITELARLPASQGAFFAARGQEVFWNLELLGKPTIAAVNGFALGGGCELAMACNLRIASTNAKFGQPEVKLGIIPGYGGTQRLPRLVGKGIALELLMSGRMIDAEEALRIGLVNRVVSPPELIPTCRAVAKEIMARGPIAVKLCQRAVVEGLEMPLREALSFEASLFGITCATEDRIEGTSAFLEKREPRFQGK